MKFEFLSKLRTKGLFSGQLWNKYKDSSLQETKQVSASTISIEIASQCNFRQLNGAGFNIPKQNSALSDPDVKLLYQDWITQFRKTALAKLLESDELELLNSDTIEMKRIFNDLNIASMEITDDYTHKEIKHLNPSNSSNMHIKYKIYENDGTFVEIEVHIKNTQVLNASTYSSHLHINNLIPGPWIETLSKDLENTAEQLRLASPTSPEYRVANAIKLNNIESDLEWD